ncbi:MAG: hypothetical protein Q4A41_04540 [Bacillota bacterium]|nr:hypothetical protein [Bacillota bacterium]
MARLTQIYLGDNEVNVKRRKPKDKLSGNPEIILANAEKIVHKRGKDVGSVCFFINSENKIEEAKVVAYRRGKYLLVHKNKLETTQLEKSPEEVYWEKDIARAEVRRVRCTQKKKSKN